MSRHFSFFLSFFLFFFRLPSCLSEHPFLLSAPRSSSLQHGPQKPFSPQGRSLNRPLAYKLPDYGHTVVDQTVPKPAVSHVHTCISIQVMLHTEIARGFPRVESYQRLTNWHPVATLGQSWDWLARCQYTVSGWNRKFDLQLLSQSGSMYNCEQIWSWDALACCWDVKQPINKQTNKHEEVCHDQIFATKPSLVAACSFLVGHWNLNSFEQQCNLRPLSWQRMHMFLLIGTWMSFCIRFPDLYVHSVLSHSNEMRTLTGNSPNMHPNPTFWSDSKHIRYQQECLIYFFFSVCIKALQMWQTWI